MAYVGLVTGGARSGKSRHAEKQVLLLEGQPIYIATAQVQDDEMSDRIAQHKEDRGIGWTTIEEPSDLCEVLRMTDCMGPRLVDCLTLWLSNRIIADAVIEQELEQLEITISEMKSPVWLVTNEVGSGIVPATSLGRVFRDMCGIMNQRIARLADRVDLVVCGQALTIKG